MKRTAWFGFVTVWLLSISPEPAHAQRFDLTGTWQDDAGGSYTIRQVGAEVFWYLDGGSRVRNVFFGTIAGNMMTGKWADLPTGELRNAGQLALRVESYGRMIKVGESQGYGGSVWTRQSQTAAGAAPSASAAPSGRMCWDWYGEFLDGRAPFSGHYVTFEPDGTAVGSWGYRGRWSADAARRSYRIDWGRGQGREDGLTLSPDGRSLQGRNFETRLIRGTLRACPP